MKKITMGCLVLAASQLLAAAEAPSDLGVSVGGGVMAKRSIYRTKDKYEQLPFIPLNITYKDFYLNLMETEMGYTFYQEDNLKLSFIGKVHMGYDSSDLKREFRAMDDRDPDFHLGIKSVYTYDRYELSAFITTDVSGTTDGQTAGVNAKANYQIIPRKLIFTPSVGATYADSGYIDYFYGVKGDEAAKGNINDGNEYRGAGSMMYNLTTAFTYIHNPSLSFSLINGVNLYDSKVENSPIVDKRYEYFGGGMFTYKFR